MFIILKGEGDQGLNQNVPYYSGFLKQVCVCAHARALHIKILMVGL